MKAQVLLLLLAFGCSRPQPAPSQPAQPSPPTGPAVSVQAEPTEPLTIKIGITMDGKTSLNGEELSGDALDLKLRQLFTVDPERQVLLTRTNVPSMGMWLR
jgi:hypothetical protein